MRNTLDSFGLGARILHWVMSPLIIGILIVGFYMTGMENSSEKFALYGLHKSFGILILAMALIRIMWRFSNITPALPLEMPSWQVLGYKIGVFAMYCLMLGMPISGLAMSLFSGRDVSFFGLFSIPSFEKSAAISSFAYNAHGLCAWAFILFISLHSLVALYHHFIDKDRLLMRMILGR